MAMCSRYKQAQKRKLIAMYGLHCWLCHRPIDTFEAATLDHIKPRKDGGSNSVTNLRLAHKRCNNLRGHSKPPTLKLREDMILQPEMAEAA